MRGNPFSWPTPTVARLKLSIAPLTALLFRLDEVANALLFVAMVALPGGHSKFVVRRDPATGLYLTLSNPTLDPQASHTTDGHKHTRHRNHLTNLKAGVSSTLARSFDTLPYPLFSCVRVC